MPHVEPFKGILYNSKKVSISDVVAPPYDVISPQMQDDLYRANKYNVVRLILGKDEPGDSKNYNKYIRAKEFFNNWLKQKIFVQDKTASIYIYSQEYLYERKKKARWGFIARMRIEDPATSRVFPHEYTFARPKQDRLNLIREVKANLSSIFTLFQDRGDKIISILKTFAKKKTLFDIEQEGVRHKLWRADNKALIKKIQSLMEGQDIFIADGHHRYEAAVMYRNEMREKSAKQPYDYVMMYFSPLNQEGLTILSTHRLLKGLNVDVEDLLKKAKNYFEITTCKSSKELFNKMPSIKKSAHAFGLYAKDKKFYLLRLKKEISADKIIGGNQSAEWKKLDVSVLHGLILDNILCLREKIYNEECIIYTRDPDYAVSEVNKGNCELAFFLNPTKVNQVRAVAEKGDKMPHKSTYFYPKLLSGLVINKLD